MRRVEGFLEFHRSNAKLNEYFLFQTGENQSALFKIFRFLLNVQANLPETSPFLSAPECF